MQPDLRRQAWRARVTEVFRAAAQAALYACAQSTQAARRNSARSNSITRETNNFVPPALTALRQLGSCGGGRAYQKPDERQREYERLPNAACDERRPLAIAALVLTPRNLRPGIVSVGPIRPRIIDTAKVGSLMDSNRSWRAAKLSSCGRRVGDPTNGLRFSLREHFRRPLLIRPTRR
jgi:hypothetical protein